MTAPPERPWDALVVTESPGPVVTFAVRAQPRASREQIKGVAAGALTVALTAPPVEGEANAALIALLARTLGVAKRDVALTRGASGRNKTVAVTGLTAGDLRTALTR